MGELLLEWKNHDKVLSNKLREFFKEDYLVDFSVTCHGQHLKVHKFVLALLFPMLKESFRTSVTFPLDHEEPTKDECLGESRKKPQSQCLSLDNVADHAEDMDYLIQFAYDGKTTVPKEHADCLMRIANSMEIKSLKDSLGQWHNKNIANKAEQNDATPRRSLQTRNQSLDLSDQSVDFSSDDSVANEESSSDSMMCFDVSISDERITRSKKKTTTVSQKLQSEDDCFKKEQIQRQNSRKSIQELKSIDSEEKTNNEPVSKELTVMSTDDRIEEKKSHECPHCDFVGKYPSQLERHLRSHARRQAKKASKQYTCKTCKKRFDSKNLLNVHRDSKCGTEPLVCKYCGHRPNKRPALLYHIMSKHRVDADGNPLEKNVKCPDCDFVCYAKHQLRVHERSKHERLNKFKCKNCNYTAPYINQLERHDRVMHQNIRDYMCDECGFRFQNKHKLNHHILVRHKGIKPHKCNICDAEYSDTLSFKIHMQRHEGKVEYRFVCHICGHGLRKKFELKRHVQKKHGMELEETTTNPCQLQET